MDELPEAVEKALAYGRPALVEIMSDADLYKQFTLLF
jgi:hypothetical protein